MASINQRVDALEQNVSLILEQHTAHNEKLDAILNDLSTLTAAGGFIKKYGPTAIKFGAGVMTTLGILNPKVHAILSSLVT